MIIFAVLGLIIGFFLNICISRLPGKESPHKFLSRRFYAVEVATGLLFALLYWKFGVSLQLGISLIYACLLIIIFVIDIEHRLVLNKITYPAMILAIAFSFLWPGLGWKRALMGGGIGMIATAIPVILYPQGLGIGDVKLGVLVGLMIGFPLILPVLILAVISSALIGIALLAFRIKKRTDFIPFAPFLATATIVTLLW